jgi:MoxR-like ATPase
MKEKLREFAPHQVDPKKVKAAMDDRLFEFNATEALTFAWNAQENIILHGPGGYGKSEGALAFADYLFKEGKIKGKAFIKNFGQGITEDNLLGGLNIKVYQTEGELIYLLKKSFIEHEVVIFEEFFDSPPQVLLILKDILQAKAVRNGDQFEPIKCKMVIICTNKTPEEVAYDPSTEALLQRFLYQTEVSWSEHSIDKYVGVLRKNDPSALPNDYVVNELAEIIIKSNNKRSNKISPRTAVKAYWSIKTNESLLPVKFMYGFDSAGIEERQKKYLEGNKKALEFRRYKTLCLTVGNYVRGSEENRESFRRLTAITLLCIVKFYRTELRFMTEKSDPNYMFECLKDPLDFVDASAKHRGTMTEITNKNLKILYEAAQVKYAKAPDISSKTGAQSFPAYIKSTPYEKVSWERIKMPVKKFNLEDSYCSIYDISETISYFKNESS